MGGAAFRGRGAGRCTAEATAAPRVHRQGGWRLRGSLGRIILHLASRGACPPVAAPFGRQDGGTRVRGFGVVRDGATGSKENAVEKTWKRLQWGIPPARSGESVAHMERVPDVYKPPYDRRHPLICVDETPRQLTRETRLPPLAAPGKPAGYDYKYERCGVRNVFPAVEPLAGQRLMQVTERKTKPDGAHFAQTVASRYSEAEKITLVMDNLNPHGPGPLYETFAPAQAKALWDRFESVYTPKHGSWSNMAEIELSVLTRQCLSRRMDTRQEMADQAEA